MSDSPPPTPRFASFLREHREQIVSRFVEEVQRKDLPPGGVSKSLLVDHVPKMLEDMTEELAAAGAEQESEPAASTVAIAKEHGKQRWELGYDLHALIREYGVLRSVILATAKGACVGLSIDEFTVVSSCLAAGISEATEEYARHSGEELAVQKERVDFLASAGQRLCASLDLRATLDCLTALLVPRFGEWCEIRLDDLAAADAIVHVDPAKADILRELHRRFDGEGDRAAGYPIKLKSLQPEWEDVPDPSNLVSERTGVLTVVWKRGNSVKFTGEDGHRQTVKFTGEDRPWGGEVHR